MLKGKASEGKEGGNFHLEEGREGKVGGGSFRGRKAKGIFIGKEVVPPVTGGAEGGGWSLNVVCKRCGKEPYGEQE